MKTCIVKYIHSLSLSLGANDESQEDEKTGVKIV